MDFRDHSIVTQVAFKAAVEVESELDLTSPEGQGRFEEVFSFLHESLVQAVRQGESPSTQAANLIHANFPGTTDVTGQTSNANTSVSYAPPAQPQAQAEPVYNAQPSGQVIVKGSQHGPLPDWLYQQAGAKGVSEVYDNRDRAVGTKRPWFRATVGGENAPAFWPPR